VIAGQGAAGDRGRSVQLTSKFEVVAIGRGIEGEVAAVDDEIGALHVDVFAHPTKIVGQISEAAARWVSEICVRRNRDMPLSCSSAARLCIHPLLNFEAVEK
jgi:hypothetical protein